MEYSINENSHLPVLTAEQMEESPMAENMFKATIADSFDNDAMTEGCWFFPLTQEDKTVYDSASRGSTMQAVLRNDSLFIGPLINGTVLQLITQGNTRPVLDMEWLHTTLLPHDINLKELLADD